MDAAVQSGLEFFHHLQKSAAIIDEYERVLVPRLRKERNEARKELRPCQEALKLSNTSVRVLEKSAEGYRERIEKREKENVEAQQLVENLTKSLEETKTYEEALREDVYHERGARERAEKRSEEAAKKAADAEHAEKACRLSYDNLQKDYSDVCASLELRKREAESFSKKKLELSTQHLKNQELLTDQLSTKDAEILELRKQLLEAKSPASIGVQVKAQVEEVVKKLKAELRRRSPSSEFREPGSGETPLTMTKLWSMIFLMSMLWGALVFGQKSMRSNLWI